MKEENKLALIVGYYLSRFDEAAYTNLGYETQHLAHHGIGEKLGVKPATIKNMRDEFDPFHENSRKGWHKRAPIKSRTELISQFKDYSEEELRKRVQEILNPNLSSRAVFSEIEHEEIPSNERALIEGEIIERKVLAYKRNSASAEACKKRDKYTCQSCGFWHKDEIVECHHLKPLSMIKESIVKLDNLVTLCPTCHRLAHSLLNEDIVYTEKAALIIALKSLNKKMIASGYDG